MQRPYAFKLRDVLILLVTLVALVIIFQKILIRNDLRMPPVDFAVHVVAEQKGQYLLDNILPGDHVYQRGASVPFGKIVEVVPQTANIITADDYGGMHLMPVSGLYDIHITIDTTGFVSVSGSPIVDRTFFHLNMYLPLFTERADFPVRVIGIDIKS